MQFQLVAEQPKPAASRRAPSTGPRPRSTKEPELTRRDRELIHDAAVYSGNYSPTGMSEAQPINPDEEWFRHFFWKDKRKRVRIALASSGTGPRQLENFDNCGSECVIEWSDAEQRYRLRGSYCHSRHCEPCCKAKANLLAANLRDRLNTRKDKSFRFVTLTLLHSITPLNEQIARLYSCWRRLRQTPLWKKSQQGGAAMLEVKWNPKSRKWHPHLHIVAEGGYLNSRELSQAWLKITGDSMIVDIRRLDKTKDVAFYVAKYVTKGTNREVWEDDNAAIEWVTSTKGVRTCATFGNWRGFKLLAKPKDSGGWVAVALLRSVAAKARAGEVHSINLLLILEDSFQYNPGKPRHPKIE